MAGDELKTYAENTWCPGCGNFGILNAFKRAVRHLGEIGIPQEQIMISAGIGCHAKIFDYLNLSGLYSIHGRSMTTIQGMKLANPELKVVTFAGDGDAYGEGLAHMIFAAKRNADITVIVHDNEVYGLTTGQFTPTSKKGFKGRSTPKGSVEEPINPITMMLEAGATFVARGYSGKIQNLADSIANGIQHKGFSFIEVLQPCISFNDTYKLYNSMVEILEKTPDTIDAARALAVKTDTLPVGVFYQKEKPPYHTELYGDWNPVTNKSSKDDRRADVNKLLEP
jgi:2-oxoglutarate ferredoxin oxidoreductase subunit beta